MTKLSETQISILKAAAKRADGNIEPLPNNVRPNIKMRVINALLDRKLITKQNDIYCISDEGYAAVGIKKPTKATRKNKTSKQQIMIDLLKRSEGATLNEISSKTGWQKHTIHGAFSNIIKKRLGLSVESFKDGNNPRHYKIKGEAA